MKMHVHKKSAIATIRSLPTPPTRFFVVFPRMSSSSTTTTTATAAAKIDRCEWAPIADEEYTKYHDEEWGRPSHDDAHLFEMLCLEGAQAGLSWTTILRKRAGYKKAFCDWDVKRVAAFDAARIDALVLDAGIVRHRGKIEATVANAKAILAVQREFGSLDKYLWAFVDHKPILNNFQSLSEIPSATDLSTKISKELKKRGFRFVGPTTIYAFMQAVGMVNDHSANCFLFHGRAAVSESKKRAAESESKKRRK
jgi:DNA-3-methyladenine glycosylase I